MYQAPWRWPPPVTPKPPICRQADRRRTAQSGRQLNLAPSVDVNCNPANPIIGVRSYGDTPATVAKYAAGMIRGLQDGGVLCLAKHFPGHGDTSLDSTSPCPV